MGAFITKITVAEIHCGAVVPLPDNFAGFTNLIKDFCTHIGQTIKSSKKLAEMMAGKARLLSDKKFDNLNGPTFSILKSNVSMIRYKNGTKDIFKEEIKNETISSTRDLSSDDIFRKGERDASRYYTGYKPAGALTFITSLLSPAIGIIPAIACLSTPPLETNLKYPSEELMKQSSYNNGYMQKAKKIKQGRVWRNWGIGFGINFVAILIMMQ